ncbi:uncharacterized protein PRCAT00001671001 [Priceomyces carsonii]|uniref:uncharacterized protein n=1 Tax=Priceomyces carsonii TaxID=28549 RepID=UPI002EDB31C5|nr:unnamed protein product [Priceomyces carsonii]
MNTSFHFALLRVSILQILKASGFEKCNPSVLNALTDIYIHFFNLLVRQSIKLSIQRKNSSSIGLQDVTQAMLNVSLIKPDSFEPYLNFYDLPKFNDLRDTNSTLLKSYNTKTMKSFANWVRYSDSFRIGKKLSEVPKEVMRNLMQKRKIDLDDSSEQDKKRRRHKEKQDYYNKLRLNDEQDFSYLEEDQDDELVDKSYNLLWLNYLIEKDLKLGHNLKFFNSSLFKEFLKLQNNPNFHPITDKQSQDLEQHLISANKNDHIVLGVDESAENPVFPSSQLTSILPYNLTYNPTLVDGIESDENDGIENDEIGEIET